MHNSRVEENYVKIRLSCIHPTQPVPVDIFVIINDKYVHYLRAGDYMRNDRLMFFERKAPDQFFIRGQDKAAFQQFLKAELLSDNLRPNEKAFILRESSMAIVEDLFETNDMQKAMDNSKTVVADFIDFLGTFPGEMSNLLGLSSHDFYTYNHSLDVSIYSIGLGRLVGYEGQDLFELGQGGLFHDIGKKFISLDIICKAGALTDEEWVEMQKHPGYGLSILSEHKTSEAIKASAFEHHENFMGGGYPQGLSGLEIHPMARVVAVADTYDALTTKRSYSEPMMPLDALELMKTKLVKKFDPELLRALEEIMARMKKNSRKAG